MSGGWSCFICGRENELGERFCPCGAARPRIYDFAAPASAERSSSSSSAPAPQAVTESPMLSGLAMWVNQAACGQLSPSQFADKVQKAQSQLEGLFSNMLRELSQVDAHGEKAYLRSITTSLEDAATLFRIALSYLAKFGQSKKTAHLRVGMMLAERAEEAYVGVEETLAQDAQGYSLRHQGDVVGRLAQEVLAGRMTLEEYRSQLDEVDKAAHFWLREGQKSMESGLAAARAFTGRGAGLSEEAARRLAQAAQQLGQVILALYSREEVERVAKSQKS